MGKLGDNIRNLRERMGVSQDKLAEWLGVSRPIVSQIEQGQREAGSKELFGIADFFGCTVSDLLAESRDLEAVGVRFRRSMDIEKDDSVWKAVTESIRLARESANLREILGIGVSDLCLPGYSIPPPQDRREAVRKGYDIAQKERNRLGLGSERIENLGELMEAEGVYAGVLEMPYEISGFTITLDDVGSICMVNERHAGLRRRFSLAHEYGHVLMDSKLGAVVSKTTENDELIEVRANVFAAAFLVPETGCMEMIRRIGKGSDSRVSSEVFDGENVTRIGERNRAEHQQIQLYDAARLAFYFGVSIQAMLYRLKNMGLVSQAWLDVLMEKESSSEGAHLKSLMKQHDTDDRLEEPDLFRCTVINMALEALRRGEISAGKCLEVGRLACAPDQYDDFRGLVLEIADEEVPAVIPEEETN